MICLSTTMFIAHGQPANYFTVDAEGWTAEAEGLGVDPNASWAALNGNPMGCFKGTDNASGSWYFNSSMDYGTGLSSFYGAQLFFDLKQNANTFQTNEPDVMICKADGSRIVYNTSVNPGTSWTTYAVPLLETGWRYNTLVGLPVSYTDMLSFLEFADVIKIRGDYSSITTETNWLDNVKIINPILLPITLINFSGMQYSDTESHLEWLTSTETNCNYFQIEKSVNGGANFDSIGSHRAVGNSNAVSSYKFIDHLFGNSAYYRLKTVDFDNANSYSDYIYVEHTNIIDGIIVYPNPSNGIIHLMNKNGFNPASIISVFDIHENLIYNTSINTVCNQFTIPLTNLSSGIYFISVKSEENISTFRAQIL